MIRRPLRAASILLGIAATCVHGAAGSFVPGVRPVRQDDRVIATQAGQAPARPGERVGNAEQIGSHGTPSTDVDQLPQNLTLRADATPPESALDGGGGHASDSLYREVAAVWQAIRQRGQQPTPELIAKEIGPENLARFLTLYPGAERIFANGTLPPPTPVDPPMEAPGDSRPD